MRHALYVAPFCELSDPRAVVELAVAAEESGWDAVFLWDHLWRPPERASSVGDAWITLSAIAASTTRIRIGPMVVPLARRRPQRVARETVALDRLSGGKLTLGVGLGVDTGGELQRFAEVSDDVARGEVLDEAIDVLLALWSGEVVQHVGAHFTVDDVRFLPTPLQRPRIPIWAAARGPSGSKPLRRASRLDGIFPVTTSPEQLRRMLGVIGEARGTLEGFDVAMLESDVTGPTEPADLGVTWLVRALDETEPRNRALRIASSPPG